MSYTIVIGNKNYSSWSLRPWLVLDHFGLPYEEVMVHLDQPDTRGKLLSFSPSAKVPVLMAGDFPVWDSLAIVEYLAEMHPGSPIWPQALQERARARSLAMEMHSGFSGLRSGCPMNLRKEFEFAPRGGAQATRDVARFEAIVQACLDGADGPFLFGEWGAVDAMFTPLATRLITYDWPISDVTRGYCDALLGTESFLKWREAALAETMILPADEVD